MRILVLMFGVCLCAFSQQTVETVPLRAVLSASGGRSGTGTVWVHVVRDSSGQITSGSVDFSVDLGFSGGVTVSGVAIQGGAGGPVAIDSGLAAPFTSSDGKGTIRVQAQASASELKALLDDPAGYDLSVQADAGTARGQLHKADMVVLAAVMKPQNEAPNPPDINASAVAGIVALRTADSGRVAFDVRYNFGGEANFTGLHIHSGAAGTAGPVTIGSGLSGTVPADSGGAGLLHYEAEVDISNPAAVDTLNGLFVRPSQYYVNLHTSAYPGGAARGQLRFTDRAVFQLNMRSDLEVPAVSGFDAGAPAAVTFNSLRAADGTVPAAVVIFDVNARFPGAVEFNGLHLHNGKQGEAGPATVAGLNGLSPVTFESGAGNLYRVVTLSNLSGVATLNALLSNPENVYADLHTRANPGGATRAQLAPASSDLPHVGFAMSSVSDQSRQTVAPGGLMTIFGNNLTKVPATLAGLDGDTVPRLLNGTEVTIGGRNAALVSVDPGYAVVQVPVATGPGRQDVIARTANGAGNAYSVNVAPVAPALYFDSVGGIVMQNNDFSLIRPDHPARAGDLVVIWSTGLGQTSPPLATGQLATASPLLNTQPVGVTLGGRNADVVYSVAAPGFVGLYQTGVRVPNGASGSVPLVVQVNGESSNTVNIAVE